MLLAQTAMRASTGLLQEEQLRHRARHVRRTRPRQLRALVVPPALALRVTAATLGQGIAQRA